MSLELRPVWGSALPEYTALPRVHDDCDHEASFLQSQCQALPPAQVLSRPLASRLRLRAARVDRAAHARGLGASAGRSSATLRTASLQSRCRSCASPGAAKLRRRGRCTVTASSSPPRSTSFARSSPCGRSSAQRGRKTRCESSPTPTGRMSSRRAPRSSPRGSSWPPRTNASGCRSPQAPLPPAVQLRPRTRPLRGRPASRRPARGRRRHHALAHARALVLAAREAGIATVYIPHAPVISDARLVDLPVDYAGLRGPAEVDHYESLGAPGKRLTVVGNPAMGEQGARAQRAARARAGAGDRRGRP